MAPDDGDWVSQVNCERRLALTPAQYLARREAWNMPFVRDGKLVLTRKADWDAEFERRAARAEPRAEGVDAVIARLGLRRVGAR